MVSTVASENHRRQIQFKIFRLYFKVKRKKVWDLSNRTDQINKRSIINCYSGCLKTGLKDWKKLSMFSSGELGLNNFLSGRTAFLKFLLDWMIEDLL